MNIAKLKVNGAVTGSNKLSGEKLSTRSEELKNFKKTNFSQQLKIKILVEL